MKKFLLAVLVDNKPGVLTHVAGLISRRAFNIESISAGYTEEPDVTRINIVVSVESEQELSQVVNQLSKLIDVIKIINLDEAPFISYELAMIKVRYDTPQVRDEPHGFPAGLRGGLDGALFPLADGGQENRWMRYGNRTKNRHGIPPPVNSF